MTRTINAVAVISALSLIFGWGFAQSSQHEQHHGKQGQQQGMMQGQGQGGMMEQCQMMKAEHQEMMSKTKAGDQELKSLVETMKAAAEDQKLEVMENLLTKIVESRTQMHERMMGAMMPQMMQHMSQHMQMVQKSGDASMMDCPMMSGHSEHSEGSGTMQNQGHQP